MNRPHCKTRLITILLGAVILAPSATSRAQTNEDQQLAARRQANLQLDELTSDDGQIIDQNEVLVPPAQPVAPVPVAVAVVRASEPQSQTVFRPATWRGRYYGRPYAGYYYGPPRASRFWDYGPGYYQPNYGGYGYRTNYGTPDYYGRTRYYGYPYGGTARVGPLRFYWR